LSKRSREKKSITRVKAINAAPLEQPTDETEEHVEDNETQCLTEMNQKHAVVSVGGKTLILSEERDPIRNRTSSILSSFADLKKLYSNRSIGKNDLGTWWAEHAERRQYKRIVF